MRQSQRKRPRTRSGLTAILALIFLGIFATLAIAFATTSDLEIRKTSNDRAVTRAQWAAESGLSLTLRAIGQIVLPDETDSSTLLANLATPLSEAFVAAGSSDGLWTVSSGGAAITTPTVMLAHGQFVCRLTYAMVDGRPGCMVTSTGTADGVSRQVSIGLSLVPRRSAVFDYGVASYGKITITGNALIGGDASPNAKLLSVSPEAPSIEVSASGTVGGNLYVVGTTEDYIDLGNAVTVGDSSDTDAIISDYCHFGTDEPEFPELNIAPIAALAVNDFVPGEVLTNMRIPAGTNPSFSSDTVINGVLYIESPNQVKFSGQATINGIIVTEEDSTQSLANCVIEFRGGVSAPGVDALPEHDHRFTEIKTFRNSAILAPGFEVDFRGNTESINGVIAADQVTFSGNSTISGEFTGPILGLTDNEMIFGGSSEVTLNSLDPDVLPGGWFHPDGMYLLPIPDSYGEGPYAWN